MVVEFIPVIVAMSILRTTTTSSPSVNVSVGPKEDRPLITGLHTVADIYCNCCQTILGWKYEEAFEEAQKYKEGKFIIEKAKMTKETGWT